MVGPDKLRRVAEMMAGAVDYYQMQLTLSKEFGVSMRTIRSYRDRVLKDMSEQLEEAGFLDPGLEKILAVSRLEHLYALAVGAKDIRTAMHIVKTRALIAGVLNPDRIEINVAAPLPPLASADGPEDSPQLAAKRSLAARLARSLVGDATLVHNPPAVTTPVAVAAKGGAR